MRTLYNWLSQFFAAHERCRLTRTHRQALGRGPYEHFVYPERELGGVPIYERDYTT